MAILSLFVLTILFLTQTLFSTNSFAEEFSLSSLESGFENVKYVTLMSSSFFFLAVLFVLFDLELILMLPLLFLSEELVWVKISFAMVLLSFVFSSLVLELWFSGLKWQS